MHGFPVVDRIKLSIPGRDVSVQVAGNGVPILLLHGYPLDSRMWDRLVPLLAKDYLCIAPDLRGFGKNAEETKSFSIVDLADDCAKVLDALQIRRPCIVCGLSMGGYVAMQFVERHLERVASVILTNTRCNADDAAGASSRRSVATSALRNGVFETVAPMFEKLLSEATLRTQPSVVETVRSMMFETKASTIAWSQLAMAHREDFGSKMKSWNLPVTCVGGAMDPICPPGAIEQMVQAIPHSKMVIVNDSAHLTPLERPDEFAAIIRRGWDDSCHLA